MLNRIATVSEDANTTQAVYAYLPDGGTDTLTYPNSTQAKYTYDNAGRLSTLTHTNTATNTVLVSYTNTYDGMGRLSQVVDTASSLTETYGWNGDSTLSSYPTKKGYSVLPDYDEEGQLISLTHKDNATNALTKTFEYGYAFDGGRRYKNDYTLPTPTQTWFPCGSAPSAGERTSGNVP